MFTKMGGIRCRIKVTRNIRSNCARSIIRPRGGLKMHRGVRNSSYSKMLSSIKRMTTSKKCKSAPSARVFKSRTRRNSITTNSPRENSPMLRTSFWPKSNRPSKRLGNGWSRVRTTCRRRIWCPRVANASLGTKARNQWTNQPPKTHFCNVTIISLRTGIKVAVEWAILETAVRPGTFQQVITICAIWMAASSRFWILPGVATSRNQGEPTVKGSFLPNWTRGRESWAPETGMQLFSCSTNRRWISSINRIWKRSTLTESPTKKQIKASWKMSTKKATLSWWSSSITGSAPSFRPKSRNRIRYISLMCLTSCIS